MICSEKHKSHEMHDSSILRTNVKEKSFVVAGLHIKWYALLKHVLLFVHIVYYMYFETVNVQECIVIEEATKTEPVEFCSSSCLWLTAPTSKTPLLLFNSNICALLQAMALLSCISVLAVVYCRHRQKHLNWTFRRYLVMLLAVIPSVVVELAVVTLWFYTLVIAVKSRIGANWENNSEVAYFNTLRAIMLATVVAIAIFLELALHVFSMLYLISFPKYGMPLYEMVHQQSPQSLLHHPSKNDITDRSFCSGPPVPPRHGYQEFSLQRRGTIGSKYSTVRPLHDFTAPIIYRAATTEVDFSRVSIYDEVAKDDEVLAPTPPASRLNSTRDVSHHDQLNDSF